MLRRVEASKPQAPAEELRTGLGRQPNAVLAGEHPLLRKGQPVPALGAAELDRRSVGVDAYVLVLQYRRPRAPCLDRDRTVRLDPKLVAPLEERDQVVPEQQQPGQQQDEQRIGVGLLEFGVVEAAEEKLGEPAFDEDPDIAEDVAEARATRGQVVHDRTGRADSAHGQQRPDQNQGPVRARYEAAEHVCGLGQVDLRPAEGFRHAEDADADG